jgi:nicotinate (nicotinamide) nucleotide adenylyltransferase
VHGAYGKPGLLSNTVRYEMCSLMAASSPFIEVDDVEIKKDVWSPTVDTLAAIQGRYPAARVFLLCGIDVIETFDTKWEDHEIHTIVQKFGLVVLTREGDPITDIRSYSKWFVDQPMDYVIIGDSNPLSEVSSTLVRGLLFKGLQISGLVDPQVERYIREHGLFPKQ